MNEAVRFAAMEEANRNLEGAEAQLHRAMQLLEEHGTANTRTAVTDALNCTKAAKLKAHNTFIRMVTK